MSPEIYSELALRTAKPLPFQEQQEHAAMGIVGEIGELVDAIKKHTIYGKPLDVTNVAEEVQDCFWYVNLMCSIYNIPFADLSTRPISGQVSLNLEALALTFCLGDIATLVYCEKQDADLMRALLNNVSRRLATLASAVDIDLAQARERNIAKLAARYGDKYSDFAAINRDTAAERKVLEGGGHAN